MPWYGWIIMGVVVFVAFWYTLMLILATKATKEIMKMFKEDK